MKNKKIFYARLSKTGPITPVTVKFTKYTSNNTLAVQLICAKAPWSVFATITVNLQGNPYGMETRQDETRFAYVDTNNCPWVEEFLEENHIAEPTGIYAPSGYCTYPLYQFHQDVIYEND